MSTALALQTPLRLPAPPRLPLINISAPSCPSSLRGEKSAPSENHSVQNHSVKTQTPSAISVNPRSSVVQNQSVESLAPSEIGNRQSAIGNAYYTREEAQRILNVSPRHEVKLMANVPEYLIKWESVGRGRPRKLYHYTAHAALTAHHEAEARAPGALAHRKEQVKTIAPADLEIARLRAQAVEEYQTRCNVMSESLAAVTTCAEWQSRPRVATVTIKRRLKNSHGKTKKEKATVTVGGFGVSTLRRWAAAYRSNLVNLVPERKNKTGRKRIDVPERIINLVYYYATKGPRANFAAAIARVRALDLPEFPDCSDATIDRRIQEMDPQRYMQTLGKKGIGAFTLQHTPDIEIDRSQMRLNELWELDDVQMDFYCHSSINPEELVRLRGYVIIRAATREILQMVISEVPITQKQVSEMIGVALVSTRSGVPEKIKFERGTVACTSEQEQKLNLLGIKVGRTSMDGGKIHPGAIEDKGKGHFNGKAVVERAFRTLHNFMWDTPGQVGPEERHTAHANLEPTKAESIRRVKAGEPPLLPTADEGRIMIINALEEYNNHPHDGLPEKYDGQKTRNMSPNEYAASLNETIQVLDEQLLPLFLMDAHEVPIQKNGCKINNETYGRFDDELKALRGATATLHVSADHPDIAYCVELGRCIERYNKTTYEASAAQMEQKKQQSKQFRNQFEEMVASAENTIVELTRTTENPLPDRTVQTITPTPLAARADRISRAVADHRAAEAQQLRRFNLDESSSSVVHLEQSSIRNRKSEISHRQSAIPKPQSGLLAQADRLRSQVDMLTTNQDEDDLFEL